MINKPNILIVDDEPGIRDTLYYNLTDAGYNVTTAESGIDAINKIRTKKFKAILSDIVMNDGDGIMLLKELKEQSKLLPVILFTGYASIDSSIEAVNFGAYAYLKKPISIEELKKVLNKAIEKYKEDTSKEKVFNKFLRTLIKNKKLKEEKMRKDGIIENDIEIPANEKNFNLINQKMNKQIRNTNADILIITKNRVIKKNLENLLRYEKFKNVRTMETINSQLVKFHSIIIIDIDCFKRKFYEEYFKIIKTKPNIKVIAIASKENMHLLNKLKELGIKTVLQKPVGFGRILDVICWQSYLVKDDEIKEKLENMNYFEKIKGDALFYLYKRIDLKTYVYVIILSLLIGIFIFNPYSQKAVSYLTQYFFNNRIHQINEQIHLADELTIKKMYSEIIGYLERDEKRELKK